MLLSEVMSFLDKYQVKKIMIDNGKWRQEFERSWIDCYQVFHFERRYEDGTCVYKFGASKRYFELHIFISECGKHVLCRDLFEL